MPDTTADAILARARTIWATSRRDSRDRALEVGALLQQYLVTRLRPADGMSEDERARAGVRRGVLIEEMARGLGVGASKVRELMILHQTVRLLAGPEGPGALSYASLRAFRVCIQRVRGRLKRTRGDDGLSPADQEEWRIRCKPHQKWRDLFQQAAREGWASDEVISKLPGIRPGKGHGRRAAVREGPGRSADLFVVVKAGSPRDVVDLIVEAIESSPSPGVIAALLRERIGLVETRR
ncbi:MAG: hypothetical protein KGL39_37100 [Patescibacteria group bacterium]|nr:hypothetical protein [Patescibacteria group bacterium]